jgi:protein phosphatase PTC7
VQPGDVVILASDGLFDNVALDEIVRIVEEWEQGEGVEEHIGRPWKGGGGQQAAQDLAKTLVLSARELSLDKHRVRRAILTYCTHPHTHIHTEN